MVHAVWRYNLPFEISQVGQTDRQTYTHIHTHIYTYTHTQNTEELREHLVRRGYDRDVVQKQIDRATSINRRDILNTAKVAINRVPLVATYHPDRPNISKILCQHLPILHISPKMRQAVPEPPLIANRRPRNLKDLLVRASSKPP